MNFVKYLANEKGLYTEDNSSVLIAFKDIRSIVATSTSESIESIITTKDGTEYFDRDDDEYPVELINRFDIVFDMIVKYGIDYKYEDDFSDYIGIMTEEEMRDYISGFVRDISEEIRSLVRTKLGDTYDLDFQVKHTNADVAVYMRLFKDGKLMDPYLYDKVYDEAYGEVYDEVYDAVEDELNHERDDVFYFSPIASLCEWNGATKSGKYAVMDTHDLAIKGIEIICDIYLKGAPLPETAPNDSTANDNKQSGNGILGFLGRIFIRK